MKTTFKESLKIIYKVKNKKFVKNSRVFYSKKDEEILKRNIFDENFSRIYSFYREKEYSPEVITDVFLNNLWLFPCEASNADICKIHMILNSFTPRDLFDKKIKEVLITNFDIPRYLKKIFIEKHYETFNSVELNKMLNSDKYSRIEKKLCFEYIIKKIKNPEEYMKTVWQLTDKFDFLKGSDILFEDLDEREEKFRCSLAKMIITDKYDEKINGFNITLERIILKLEKNSFDSIVEFINKNPQQKKKAIAIFKYAFKIIENSSLIISNDSHNYDYYIKQLIKNFIISGKEHQNYFNDCLNGMSSWKIKLKILAAVSVINPEDFDYIINKSILRNADEMVNTIEQCRGSKIIDGVISALIKNPDKKELFKVLLQRKGRDEKYREIILKIITRIPDLVDLANEFQNDLSVPSQKG